MFFCFKDTHWELVTCLNTCFLHKPYCPSIADDLDNTRMIFFLPPVVLQQGGFHGLHSAVNAPTLNLGKSHSIHDCGQDFSCHRPVAAVWGFFCLLLPFPTACGSSESRGATFWFSFIFLCGVLCGKVQCSVI